MLQDLQVIEEDKDHRQQVLQDLQVIEEDKGHRQQVLEVRLEHKVPKDHKDHHHKDQ